MKSIEELALKVAAEMDDVYLRNVPAVILCDFATRFLAAYTEQQEPVGWMDRDGDFYHLPIIENWSPPHTLLYAAPVVPADMVLMDAVRKYGSTMTNQEIVAMIAAGEKKS